MTGNYDIFSIDEVTGNKNFLFSDTNTWVHTWGCIVARCAGLNQPEYAIKGFYVEFENVASPSTNVVVPTIDLSDGLDYFLNLASSSTKDYMRISLASTPLLGVATNYSDVMPANQGNKITLSGITSGTTGLNGKSFSHSSNSKIYGLAVVVTPVIADPTRDIIYARSYFDVSNQILKVDGQQVSVSYNLNFTLSTSP